MSKMNLHDTSHRRENQGAQPGELPIQLESAALHTLATFLEYPPDALMVVDEAGTIVLVNTQAETLFGYTRDELIGQPVERLLPESLRASHTAHRTRYLQAARTQPMSLRLDLLAGQRKDGSQFPVEISLRPMRIKQRLHVMASIRDMTAQREIEREQMQVAQRLHQQDKLLSMAHDAILVRDPANHLVSWNEGAEHLYGWTAQDVAGQVTHTLLQTRFPTSQEEVEHMLEAHGQWQGELTHTCRDGRQVIVESRQVLVRDERGEPSAILEINRDVTERHRLEHLEREARTEVAARLQLVQLILDRLTSGVFLVQGAQLRLLMANQAVRDIWGAEWERGQPQEEFLRHQGIQLLAPNGQPLASDQWPSRQALATGSPVRQRQMVIRRANGTRFPVLVDAIPFTNLSLLPRLPQEITSALSSAESVVLLIYQDVSALKEAEALKDQFISLATHELRTPVTVITGYADRLLSRATQGKGHELDEWQREKIQEMKQASWQLASLTEDLLDVTRMQAGQFELERHATDLVALTQRVVKRLQATTHQHQLTFQTTLASLRATIDVCRVEQVLSNLLSNAIKYSPDGGPIEVTLEEHPEPHEARFAIHDQGMGIPYAQQAHVFGRFVRGENVCLAGIRGTGLGLYLCQELIERHGGYIGFESEEGVGSIFYFSLPCTEGVQQEQEKPFPERGDSAFPSP